MIGGIFTDTPFPFGVDAQKTAQEVFNQVNAAGGIQGRKIQYETGDDAANPTKAAELARQFVGGGAVAMAGSASFVDCGTNQAYYIQSGILAVQSIGVDPFCYDSPNIVSVEVSAFSQITADLYYASQYLGDSRICLFQPLTPGTGTAIANAISDWSKITGKKLLISSDSLPTNQSNYTPQVLRAKAENCDAVFYGGDDVVAATILKTAQSQGMSNADFMFVSVSYTPQLAATAGKYGMKVYATTGVYPYTISSANNTAWRAVASAGKASQTAFAEAGYVSANWIVSVLKSIKGPITRASVTAALHSGSPYKTPLVAVPLVFGGGKTHDRGQGINIVQMQQSTWNFLKVN